MHTFSNPSTLNPKQGRAYPTKLFPYGVARVSGSPHFAFVFATVRTPLRIRRMALLMRECIWSGLESVPGGLVTPQCPCEWCVAWRGSFHGVCRGSVWAGDLGRCSYLGVCNACPTRVSTKRVKWECSTKCQVKVSGQGVPQMCEVRVPYKKCQESVSNQSGLQKCQVRVSHKSVKYECPTRVSSRVSHTTVKKACQVRVSYRSVK